MSSYRFASFVLDVRERRLLRDGAGVPLTPKVFDTLVYLVERHGRLVRKDELLEAIWAGSYVEEGNLPRTIHVLRKALAGGNDRGSQLQFIETVPTQGYRFVVDVVSLGDTVPDVRPDARASPSTVASEHEARPDVDLGPGMRPGWRRWATLVAAAGLASAALAGLAWSAREQDGLPRDWQSQLVLDTSSGAAYATFQNARLHLERHLGDDVEAAIEGFEAAIRLDPGFAAAHAGKADARFFRYWDTGAHDDIAQVRLAIREALELDGGSAYAHALQCRLLGTYDWDFVGAEAACRRAVDLDPGSDSARREMAFLFSALGRHEEALTEIDHAVVIAPTSFNKRSRGLLLYFGRRFDEAVVQLRQVEATDPEYPGASRWIARCLEQKRDYGAALDALARHLEGAGARPDAIVSLRRTFDEEGWPGVLRASLGPGQPASTLEAAGTYAQLGDPDAAFGVLESMIGARRLMIVHMDSEPRLDPVRADPRYEELARRVGLR